MQQFWFFSILLMYEKGMLGYFKTLFQIPYLYQNSTLVKWQSQDLRITRTNIICVIMVGPLCICTLL